MACWVCVLAREPRCSGVGYIVLNVRQLPVHHLERVRRVQKRSKEIAHINPVPPVEVGGAVLPPDQTACTTFPATVAVDRHTIDERGKSACERGSI